MDKLDHPFQLGIVIVLWLRDISSVRPVLPGSGESENAMRFMKSCFISWTKFEECKVGPPIQLR